MEGDVEYCDKCSGFQGVELLIDLSKKYQGDSILLAVGRFAAIDSLEDRKFNTAFMSFFMFLQQTLW